MTTEIRDEDLDNLRWGTKTHKGRTSLMMVSLPLSVCQKKRNIGETRDGVANHLRKTGFLKKGWVEQLTREVDIYRCGSLQEAMIGGFYIDASNRNKVELVVPPGKEKQVPKIRMSSNGGTGSKERDEYRGEEDIGEVRNEIKEELERIEQRENEERKVKQREKYRRKKAIQNAY